MLVIVKPFLTATAKATVHIERPKGDEDASTEDDWPENDGGSQGHRAILAHCSRVVMKSSVTEQEKVDLLAAVLSARFWVDEYEAFRSCAEFGCNGFRIYLAARKSLKLSKSRPQTQR